MGKGGASKGKSKGGAEACKFGMACTNKACYRLHPQGRHIDQAEGDIDVELCRFGTECNNKACHRLHPQGRRIDEAEGSVQRELCRFGTECTNKACYRLHPQGRRIDQAKGDVDVELCRFGRECSNKACHRLHPQGRCIDEADGGVKRELCRFGTECTNKACHRQHPDGRQIDQAEDGDAQKLGPVSHVQNCFGRLCEWSDCRHAHSGQGVRVKPCISGSGCKKAACCFAHPREWYGPCPAGRVCVRLECPFQHKPEDRRATCERGLACTEPGCTGLHPEGDVGLMALEVASAVKKALPAMQQLRQVRFMHQGLVAAAHDKARTARQQALEVAALEDQKWLYAEAKVQEAKIDELRAQIGCFDNICSIQLPRLLELSRAGAADNESEEGQDLQSAAREDGQHEAMEETRLRQVGSKQEDQDTDENFVQSMPEPKSSNTPSKRNIKDQMRDIIFRLKRESARLKAALPALAKRKELSDLLEVRRNVVVRGATGSGKSTQLPQYLADDLVTEDADPQCSRIICTQPRKLAAIALAKRVADEWGSGEMDAIGEQVGYQVSGRRLVRPWTKIVYTTEELLLQQLIRGGSKNLRGIKAIVLDEAHERTIKLDILLGWLTDIQSQERPDLKLIVTSATLDVQLFSRYWGGSAVVEIPGRMFPVDDVYDPPADVGGTSSMQHAVVQKVLELHRCSAIEDGDILAFLLGQREVEAAKGALEAELAKFSLTDCSVFSLHGGQDPEDQAPVFKQLPRGFRKIVFATNVAETSLTIDGIRMVVDSGLEKRLVFDARRNLSSLEEVPISKSSAQQRRGRAGRTAPGTCIRLYSADSFDAMLETQVAELLSSPVDLTLLTLLRMGLDPSCFSWLEPPPDEAVKAAWSTLRYLGAIESLDGTAAQRLSDFGRCAAELQIDPCRAKILSSGSQLGLLQQAADLVGVMSVHSMLFRKAQDEEARQQQNEAQADDLRKEGDIFTAYRLYCRWLSIRAGEGLDEAASGSEGEQEQGPAAGRGAQLQRNRRQATDFCKTRWLKPRSLELARSTSQQLQKQFRQAQGVQEEDANAQCSELTDDELMRLLLSGCCLNLGVRVGGLGDSCISAAYHLVNVTAVADEKPDQQVMSTGAIFPGSVMARAGRPAPQFLCYISTMQTSKLFLHGVTPIAADSVDELVALVQKLCPYYASLLQQYLLTVNVQRVKIDGFTKSMLTGPRARLARLQVQEQFKCTAFFDVEEGVVSCWCLPAKADDLQQHLMNMRQSLTEALMLEVHEELLGGHTRVVYGMGGQVVTVLFPGECLSVNVLGLPVHTTEAEFRQMVARYGPIRLVRVVASADNGKEAASLFCQASFIDKASAGKALRDLRSDCKHLVSVFPSGIRQSTSSKEETGFLRISLDCSEKVGNIHVDTPGLDLVMANLRCLVPLIEEAEMEPFVFEREVPDPDNVGKGNGKGHGPFPDLMKKQVIAGWRVVYLGGLEFLDNAMKAWQTPSEHELADACFTLKMLQSLRCEVCYQAVMSVHKSLVDHFLDVAKCPKGVHCKWSDCERHLQLGGKDKRPPSCRYGQNCRRNRDGEKACKFLHPRAWYEPGCLPDSLPENPLTDGLKWCKDQGIKVFSSTKGERTSFRLQHNRLEQLRRGREQLQSAFSCSLFLHDDKDLLFEKPGLQSLQHEDIPGCVHWDRSSRTIRVYGSTEERQRGLEKLALMLMQLKRLEKKQFSLQPSALKVLRATPELLPAWLREHGLPHFSMRGTLLEVWLDKGLDIFKDLAEAMQQREWIRQPKPRANIPGTCPGCMCDYDDDVWQLQACGHRFCTACIKSALSNPDGAHFPISCPCPSADRADGMCAARLVWRDLIGISSPEGIARIKRIGVAAAVREQPGLAMYCPKTGCGHLLMPPAELSGESTERLTSEEQRRLGGASTFCELCATSYCIACSEKAHKPIISHRGYSCEEAQQADSPTVKQHRDHIANNLLTLRCPRCKQAFMEYTGCAAIKCNCGCGFCAKCFKDCGSDAHSHTNVCRGPGIPSIRQVSDGYYLSTQEFDRLCLEVAQYKVQDYLDGLPEELRRSVAEACRQEFEGRPGGSLHVKL